MKKQILGAIVAALALSTAQASVIDFTGAAEGGFYTVTGQSYNGPQSYTAQGFKFDSVGDEGHMHDNLLGFGTAFLHDNSPYNQDSWVLTKVGGGTFDLTSFTVLNYGTGLHWSTNLNTVGANAVDGLNTLNLVGISSLSLKLINAYSAASIDQFVVNENTPAAGVPEPASLALLGLGLLGLGVSRRKRK